MKVKFWYPIGEVEQLVFGEKGVKKELPVGDGHIVYSEVLMCKQSREKLKNEVKAKKERLLTTRLHNVSICEECQERYRNHPDSPYAHWIGSPPTKHPAAKEAQ